MPVLQNSRQEAFARNLALGMSGDEAYRKAGYKPSRSAASRLSSNVNVQARVAELKSRGAERTEISVARVLEELGRIGFSDLRRVFTAGGALLRPEDWDDETAKAVQSVKVVTRPSGEYDGDGNPIIENVHELKLWDKLSALDKIGRHLKMFTDKVDISNPDGSLAPRVLDASRLSTNTLKELLAARVNEGSDSQRG